MNQKVAILGGVLVLIGAGAAVVLPPLLNQDAIRKQRAEDKKNKAGLEPSFQRGSMWKEMDSKIKDNKDK